MGDAVRKNIEYLTPWKMMVRMRNPEVCGHRSLVFGAHLPSAALHEDTQILSLHTLASQKPVFGGRKLRELYFKKEKKNLWLGLVGILLGV